MSFEMAMLMNWLLVAAGLLASDLFSDLFDGSSSSSADDDDVPMGETQTFGTGDDVYLGTDFGDTVFGQAGADSLDGAGGDDIIEGNTGDDSLLGGLGNDILAGGGDTDTIFGGAGNDVLSSDRSDMDADFSRGNSESLDGGAGDDLLYFSADDVVSGGEGADTFGMVNTDEGAARISDFETGEDSVVIYVEGLDEAATPPVLTYDTDVGANLTTVSMDGAAVLEFDGVFTEAELGVTLADSDTIDFSPLP